MMTVLSCKLLYNPFFSKVRGDVPLYDFNSFKVNQLR